LIVSAWIKSGMHNPWPAGQIQAPNLLYLALGAG